MALGQRRPRGVIHHSDHGSQDTALAFGQRCDEAGVRPSRGSVGDCFDNAMCESFFATLECELLDRTSFKTQAAARMALFDFIEGWYNPHRRHSALDYLAPIDYERAHTAQPGAPCRNQGSLKESAPPPLAGGEIRKEPTINATSAGESLIQLPSPTPSTESVPAPVSAPLASALDASAQHFVPEASAFFQSSSALRGPPWRA